MGTITAVLVAVAAFIAAVFGAWARGRSTGKTQAEQKNQAEQVTKEKDSLKAEKEGKEKSEKQSQKIESEIDSLKPGGASDWLRQNANRDDQ